MKEDLLFSLVRSLDKAEKRYFMLHQDVYERAIPGSTQELFTTLDKEKSYDETAFLTKHNGKKFTRFYRAEKNQLQHQLLLSLARMEADKKLALQLRSRISAAELLVEKKQITLARRLLVKARETAIEANYYEIALDAMTIETRLYSTASTMPRLKEVYAVRRRLAALIGEEDRYATLLIDFILLMIRFTGGSDPEAGAAIETMKNETALQDENHATSPKAKVMRHQFWSNYYLFFPNEELRYFHFVKQFETLTANLFFARAHMKELNGVVFNLSTTAYTLGRTAQLEDIARFFQTFVPTVQKTAGKSLLLEFDTQQLLAELYAELLKGNFAAVVAKRKKTLELAALHSPDTAVYQLLLFSLAIAQFGKEEYRAAIRTLQLLLNAAKGVYTEDLKQKASFLLSLLCHYSLGNTGVVEQQAGNALRQLKKETNVPKVYTLALEFLVQLTNEDGRKASVKAAVALQKQLAALDAPLEKTMLQFIAFFRTWLESVRSGESFAEVWRRN